MEQESDAKQLAVFTQDDYTLYCSARRVADLVFKAADELNNDTSCPFKVRYFDDCRKGPVNPFHGITDQGLILEFHYGHPSKIHTPWGLWSFNGSLSWSWKEDFESQETDIELLHELALKKVGVSLQLLAAGKKGIFDYEGPYYKINALQESPLPETTFVSYYDDLDIEEINRIEQKWAAMTAKYDTEKH